MICQGRLFTSFVRSIPLLSFIILTACGSAKPGWQNFPVPIYSDSGIATDPQAYSDLKDAMNFWETQSGQKLFDFHGVYNSTPYTGSASSPSSILANVIFFQNPWHLATSIVGQTVVNSTDENQIKSAMILINGSASFCWGDCIGQGGGQTSARKTFTHELGHFIGLSHVQDVNDIMYPQITPGGSLSNIRVNSAALRELTP